MTSRKDRGVLRWLFMARRLAALLASGNGHFPLIVTDD
jgi:hypothetical protein